MENGFLAVFDSLSFRCLKIILNERWFCMDTLINVTGVDFMSVLNEMVALVPVILPVVIGCIAFRKGLSFLFGAIRGA